MLKRMGCPGSGVEQRCLRPEAPITSRSLEDMQSWSVIRFSTKHCEDFKFRALPKDTVSQFST